MSAIASRLFTQSFIKAQIKKISKLRFTGLCAGNSPETDEFPTQMASNAEKFSIWWRHHDILIWQHNYISCNIIKLIMV